MKTSNFSADNFKKILNLDGSTPDPAIWSGDTDQRILYFDSCQLITTLMYNVWAISVFCAPKLGRKCEIEHWLPCGADGWAVYGHVITKFSGMGRFTYPWCSAGALCAPELRYNNYSPKLGWLVVTFTEAAKRRGKKPPLATDTEVNNCF